MTLKMRIELIFLGIVATAILIAIISILIATSQLLNDGGLAEDVRPIPGIENTPQATSHLQTIRRIEPKVQLANSSRDIIDYDKARVLLKNLNTEEDILQAHDLLIAATKSKGSSRAEAAFELGTIYRMFPTEECQKVAFVWFRKSAEWGFRKGYLELAKAYIRGLGVDVDFDSSIRHYRIAAELGSAAGALELVNLIHKGKGERPGDTKMAKDTLVRFLPMLESSASDGNARAARTIGRLYLAGNLLKKDLKTADDWLSQAAKFGDAAAMHDLAFLRLDHANVSDPKEVVSLLRKSAMLGYSGSMTALGRLHLQNRFKLSEAGSVDWFEQGAAAGHPGAMEELARMHLKGNLVEKNLAKARDFAMRGVKLKHEGSAAILAEIDEITELEVAVKE